MMRQVGMVMISAAVAALGTSAAFAMADTKKPRDPSEIVCERQQEIGSRVAMKRICLTRAEWEERRRLDRAEIEKAQTSKTLKGE